jgi:hypothetical protein
MLFHNLHDENQRNVFRLNGFLFVAFVEFFHSIFVIEIEQKKL